MRHKGGMVKHLLLLALLLPLAAFAESRLPDEHAPQQAVQNGAAALAKHDYETAYAQYKAAVDALPNASSDPELRNVALDGFSKAVMGLAEQRIIECRWEDAKTTVEVLLQPEYNPRYMPALRLLRQLYCCDKNTSVITRLFLQAQILCDSGQFEDALKKYEEVLQRAPHNGAAFNSMERIKARRRTDEDRMPFRCGWHDEFVPARATPAK